MAQFEGAEPYPLTLRVGSPTADPNTFTLDLDDGRGHSGQGFLRLDLSRQLVTGLTWAEALERYTAVDLKSDQLAALGRDIFRIAFEDQNQGESGQLRDAWHAIRGAAGSRPLALSVEFGRHTEAVAALPLELLADEHGQLLARPGSGLRRGYREVPAKSLELPEKPRVLYAWAFPLEDPGNYDTALHEEKLRDVFGADSVTVLPGARLDTLRQALGDAQEAGHPFAGLFLLAHGFRDTVEAGVCLNDSAGAPHFVVSQALAQRLGGHGLQWVFLCSCRTAQTDSASGAFSGVAQHLLLPEGGDIPCVVATQANLPVARSAVLSEVFHRHFLTSADPARALAEARRTGFDHSDPAWSVPVLLARFDTFETSATVGANEVGDLPPRRATYLEREMAEQAVLDGLAEHRMVSLVGLPGIGKTEVGREAARRARDDGLVRRVVYREIHAATSLRDLRTQLAIPFGIFDALDAAALAALLASQGDGLLLVLDNAEDLMRTQDAQREFRDLLDTLLAGAPELRILLTTRWLAGTTVLTERPVDVPPLETEEASRLLADELAAAARLDPSWPPSPAWTDLLALIDGHPRTLWLVSRHFVEGHTDPATIRDRLRALKTRAVVTPELLGRKDIDLAKTLDHDKKARLLSLVASMDLSFAVLAERHPEAVEAFVALSLFPGGLPDSVARAVAAGTEALGSLALDPLLRYHLVQWHNHRTFYPVPLHWYAERKRQDHPVDQDTIRSRALAGFAGFAQACDGQITGGAIEAGVDRLVAERRTLEELAEWAQSRVDDGPRPALDLAPAASLARALHNGLQLVEGHSLVERLAKVGIVAARHAGARKEEADGLRTLGDTRIRVDDLEGAEDAYQKALPIYREIRDRLGEANCLKSLGDLRIRISDLEGAEDAYQKALPIFREIRARLGEANCLQGLGLLALARGLHPSAFRTFLELLDIYRELRDGLGEQAALGYLARTMVVAGNPDQAIVLAEHSLAVGRRIGDRFGQTINLEAQVGVWLGKELFVPALAAMLVLRQLRREIQDPRAEHFTPILDQALPELPEELRTVLENDAEAVRSLAVVEAEKALAEAGIDPFAPPPQTSE